MKTALQSQNPYSVSRTSGLDMATSSSPFAAVTLGFASAQGFIYVWTILSNLTFVWILTAQGVSWNKLYVQIFASSEYLITLHIGSIVLQVFAGFWSTRFIKSQSISIAALAGLLTVMFTGLTYVVPYPLSIPSWSVIASLVAPLPAFVAGGILARRRNRQQLPMTAT